MGVTDELLQSSECDRLALCGEELKAQIDGDTGICPWFDVRAFVFDVSTGRLQEVT